jgi:formylglycine-generating enzyme required for sulfatase activity
MSRWFLSYNSQDLGLMLGLEAALRCKDPEARIFCAPTSLRAGGFWLPELAKGIAEATAFVLLIGEKGLGPWQVIEYYEALDRRVKQRDFPVILVLLDGQPAPGLPFLRQLHWIVVADPASEQSIVQIMNAAAGSDAPRGELWRHTAPYRGLAAMTEADSDFFFGRGRETVEVIRALETTPDKLPVLLGNSGVGKSSLAQAGVLGALKRQAWPEQTGVNEWPEVFNDSRHWCFLSLRPGTDPIRALVDSFLDTWQFEREYEWTDERNGWIERLKADPNPRVTLSDLLDATERRRKFDQPKSLPFLLYIDQGEELYVRAEQRERQRFSEILAQALPDARLRALISLRVDFLGELQKDEVLDDVAHKVEVKPLREAQLREVVSKPAVLLGARFENQHLADDIARRAAEESNRHAGALPLLSYFLDDMWKSKDPKWDGILRLPTPAIELGRVLVDRANAFIATHPGAEDKLRRIFTLKLATVREDGEPTRRRALRHEFSDEEWLLVSELADYPNRLLITATPETAPMSVSNAGASVMAASETYAEVAHEAIFRRWDKLREWIAAEREFLAWRSGLEGARRAWQAAPERSQNDALLMGHALAQAQTWSTKRSEDILPADRTFILESLKVARRRKLRVQALVGVFVAAIIMGLAAWRNQDWLKERIYVLLYVHTLKTAQERALKPKVSFKECYDCPEMIVVPAGSFRMGSPSSETDRSENEGPPHDVTIGKPFAVAKFELTFAEWGACVALGDCVPHVPDGGWGGGQQPVINVSWDDAQKYVAWLSRLTGRPYRLLTEAEYEYVTRAGTQTAFWWGDDVGRNNANCAGCGSQWDGKQTAPVGSFAPNPFGLYDMVGNVWEWTQDCHHSGYEGAPTDGAAWTSGDCNLRVLRGGSWGSYPRVLRSAYRLGLTADNRSNGIGFRVGRTLGQN